MEKIFAQGTAIILPGNAPVKITYPPGFDLKFTTLGDIVTDAVPFILTFAGLGLLLMLMSAGFTMLTSAGDTKKLEHAKQQLTYAIIGFLIVFLAFWLTQIVGFMFGVQEIKQTFGQ